MILLIQSSKSYIVQTYSFIPTASNGVLRRIKTGEKYGVINEIYVKKSYRGKGIGKKFIKEIISNFKKIGVKRVRITAGSENLDKLVKYYESIGFHRKTTNLVFSIN